MIAAFSIVLVVAAGVSIAAAVLVRRRRDAPGAGPLVWLLCALAWWALSVAAGRSSTTLASKLVWARVEYLGVQAVPLLWFLFAARFTGRDRWMTPARVALLASLPVLFLGLAWTNHWHGWLWQSATLVEIGGHPMLRVAYGPAGWLNVAIAYGFMLSGVLTLVAAFRSTPGFYTPQVAALLIAALAPWIANALYVTDLAVVDMTPLAFTITGIGASWALTRFHLLDLVPVARAVVLDVLRDAVFVIGGDGRIVDANRAACALIGAASPCIGERIDTVLPELDASAPTRELRRGTGAEARIYELTDTPLAADGPRRVGRLLVLHDVTGRRRAEARLRAAHAELETRVAERTEELAEANRALRAENDARQRLELELRERLEELRRADAQKNAFLATLAHELRNPLAPISNAVQVLRAAGGETGPRGRALAIVDRQVRQMARLVEDMLDLSRITRDRIQLRTELVDVRAVLRLAEETTRPLIEQLRHRYTTEVPAEPVFVQADPTRLAQVFANLIHNAAKFTDPGGEITVRLRAEPHGAVVTVRDTGIGIPGEELASVFDMFAQLEPGPGRIPGGLGIGLTLVKRLVELHGGSVAAHSDGRGRGSEFTVRLPRAATAAAPAPSDGAHLTPELSCRIAVVDDNRDSADSLSMALAAMGAEVRTAYDGVEAVALARQFRPDIVVMDIGMPRMDGCEAARCIRALEGGGDVVLVALTGWNQPEDRQRTAAAGFDYHLVKPCDAALLGSLLSDASAADSA